jgi:hypothetical protein
VTDVFVHKMPTATDEPTVDAALDEVFLKWQAEVRQRYYALCATSAKLLPPKLLRTFD